MSELNPLKHEQAAQAHFEHLSINEAHHARNELLAAHQERRQQKDLIEARHIIHETAKARDEMAELPNMAQEQSHIPTHISPELRSLTAKRALTRIQKSLPLSERVFSKVVHQKPVRVISNVTAQTLGRPTPLLTGGFVALLGTSAYLLFARYIGVEYNYFLWAVLFAAGFVLGLIIELIQGRRRAN